MSIRVSTEVIERLRAARGAVDFSGPDGEVVRMVHDDQAWKARLPPGLYFPARTEPPLEPYEREVGPRPGDRTSAELWQYIKGLPSTD